MAQGIGDQGFNDLVEETLRKLNARYTELSSKPDMLEIVSMLQNADKDMLAAVKKILEDL